MRVNKKVTAILLVLVIAVSVLAYQWMVPKNSVLLGVAYVDLPVAGATVSVYNTGGTKLFESPNATWSNGAFYVNVAWNGAFLVPQEFKVAVSGGTLYGDPFNGTIARYVEKYDQNIGYAINAITTLVAAYKDEHPSLSYASVQEDVSKFLEVPSSVSLTDVINKADHSSTYFSHHTFMREADATGDFNTFVSALVGEIDQGTSHAFHGFGMSAGNGDLLSGGFRFAATGLANGALSWVGQQAFGWAMNFLGYRTSTEQEFDLIKTKLEQISSQLNDIDNKLTSITNDLNQLSDQLVDLKNALNTVDLDINMRISNIASYGPISNILSTYSQFALYSAQPPGTFSKDFTTGWANNVLNPSTGVYYALDFLNKLVMGRMLSTEPGLLEIMTDSMINEIYQPGVPGVQHYGIDYRNRALTLYNGFQDYFENLLYIELEGLTLIVEAYHALNGTNLIQNPGLLASQYINTVWKPQIEKQVNLFISLVERFVITVEPGKLEFPNMGSLSNQVADNYYQSYCRWPQQFSSNPSFPLILPAADQFADQILTGSGKFVARVLIYPAVNSTSKVPADPKPVFKLVDQETQEESDYDFWHHDEIPQAYSATGTLKKVELINHQIQYYYVYDLGQPFPGVYAMTSPTTMSNMNGGSGWYNPPPNSQNWYYPPSSAAEYEYWSFSEGIKISKGDYGYANFGSPTNRNFYANSAVYLATIQTGDMPEPPFYEGHWTAYMYWGGVWVDAALG